MKKLLSFILIFLLALTTGCSKEKDNSKLSIVSTTFPGYDFARSIVKDTANLSTLIKPGTEVHSYDPSPKDIINIQNSDIFIYVGGESEEWVEEILESIDTSKMTIIKLMDYVSLTKEELKEGMQEEHEHGAEENEEEYDEHIWTSPINAIKLVETIYSKITEIDKINKDLYLNNKNEYIEELKNIDNDIRNIISDSKTKTLIFGDRFPFKYFVKEYNLDYYAAFPGCSSETEVSAKTISYLINKVKKENIPVVFYLEMSNKKVATTIAEETSSKTLLFHSAHNLTKEEFESGLTYAKIMKNNVNNLKEALN